MHLTRTNSFPGTTNSGAKIIDRTTPCRSRKIDHSERFPNLPQTNTNRYTNVLRLQLKMSGSEIFPAGPTEGLSIRSMHSSLVNFLLAVGCLLQDGRHLEHTNNQPSCLSHENQACLSFFLMQVRNCYSFRPDRSIFSTDRVMETHSSIYTHSNVTSRTKSESNGRNVGQRPQAYSRVQKGVRSDNRTWVEFKHVDLNIFNEFGHGLPAVSSLRSFHDLTSRLNTTRKSTSTACLALATLPSCFWEGRTVDAIEGASRGFRV